MNKKDLSRVVRLYSSDIPFVGSSKQKSGSSMSKTFFQKRVLKAKKIFAKR
ncbi:MAG: hypothetical protein U0K92_07420 [Treponema sp.]|nr:hypothetical protein [Treponema sp.]